MLYNLIGMEYLIPDQHLNSNHKILGFEAAIHTKYGNDKVCNVGFNVTRTLCLSQVIRVILSELRFRFLFLFKKNRILESRIQRVEIILSYHLSFLVHERQVCCRWFIYAAALQKHSEFKFDMIASITVTVQFTTRPVRKTL